MYTKSHSHHISDEVITKPGFINDFPYCGLGLAHPNAHYVIRNITVNFNNEYPPFYEVRIANNSSAFISNSIFKNADNLIYCSQTLKPEVKTITFINCTFENFSFCALNALGSAKIVMNNCVFKNWGHSTGYNSKGFAIKASAGASIELVECTFIQDKFWKSWKVFWSDCKNTFHEIFDNPFSFMFKRSTWLPSVCRGLIAGNKGYTIAVNCKKNKWWIYIENNYAVDKSKFYSSISAYHLCM